jgi:hypothetical protein
MGWLSGPPSLDGIDPDDLITAAHELGHVVSARAHGIGVERITMGLTRLALPANDRDYTPDQWVGWLVGCWAGFEAEKLWARKIGGKASRHECGADIRNFQTDRRKVPGMTEGKARSAARTIVGRNWSDIRKHAPTLARQGFIAPW